jgi:protein-S-isoprenylcysteine O-methyltransferase Ste14
MIEPLFVKLFLIIELILFLIGMMVPIVAIKKRGLNPHGTHKGASLLTRLTSVSTILWLLYLLLFIIIGDVVKNYFLITFLAFDFFLLLGMIISVIALVIDLFGTKHLGLNFRIELPKEETELVTSGLYAIVRNPIVLGVFLLLIGNFLMIPTLFNLFIIIFNFITFNSKVRDEEKFLLTMFGEKYDVYRSKVGKYFPFCYRKHKNKLK